MLEEWIALVQDIARLPSEVVDELGAWLRSRAHGRARWCHRRGRFPGAA
jgi:hypothetical protein